MFQLKKKVPHATTKILHAATKTQHSLNKYINILKNKTKQKQQPKDFFLFAHKENFIGGLGKMAEE